MAGGVILGIRFRFHNHAPQQRTRGLAFDQQAANEVGGNLHGRAGEEGVREGLGKGGGYGSGLEDELRRATENQKRLMEQSPIDGQARFE